jgi:hypothetical protein
MHPPTLRAMTWLFFRLVPKDFREPLTGDLAEEYAARAKATSSVAALKWYLRELCASVPPMLWIRLTRATWIATLAVALLAFIAASIVNFVVRRAIPNWTADGAFIDTPLAFLIILPAVGLIGFLAERLRRRAAFVLGALLLLVVTVMGLASPDMKISPPLWFKAVWFLLGPAAAIGGMLCSVRRSRT